MPLNVQVIRAKKPLKISWDDFSLNVILTAALREGRPRSTVESLA